MATSAQRNRAFVKERNAQIKQHILIQKDTAKEITALLLAARRKVEQQLFILPSDYQKWQLPQIKAQIDNSLREFNQLAGGVISMGADSSWKAGIDLIDKPVAAGGIAIASAMPQIDKAQLLAMKQFMTHRIADISVEAANKINAELASVIIGVQSPSDAVSKVAAVVDGGRGRAITIVRTELGRAFSTAAQRRLTEAAKYLPGMKKQWRRSGKLHSRIAHDVADGQIREHDKPFNVGGAKLMYPRDPKGSAKDTINCGCLMIPYMKHWEVKNPDRLQFTDDELRLSAHKQSLNASLKAQVRGNQVGAVRDIAAPSAITAKAAEKKALSMGVRKADFSGNDLIASHIHTVTTEMAMRGIDPPGIIKPMSVTQVKKWAVHDGVNPDDILAAFTYSKKSGDELLMFNPASPHWKNLAAESQHQFDKGWWSTNEVNHAIRHEYGHLIHYRNAEEAYIANQALRTSDRKIALTVSGYAIEGEVEFVAEVFAGLIAGTRFSDKVMALYTKLGGIRP